MRFLSLCSGIEAASQAWHPLGWRAASFSEIDPFACAVLSHYYPNVPNLGDMTKFAEWPDLGSIDLVCGGTPCQSFSVAGLRQGLDDPRGNLMLTFGAIAARYRPKWLVWENVPGVLSSNNGRDFGSFLGLLGQLGYGFAYRILDAQFVRVDSYERALPQRRRRVFVVGCFGDWRSAAAVLLERESLRGDPAPRRTAGQGVTARPARSLAIRSGDVLAPTLKACGHHDGRDDLLIPLTVAHTLRGDGFDASEDGTGRGTPLTVSYCLNAKGGAGRLDGESETLIPLPFDTTQITSAINRSNPQFGDPCHPLTAGGDPPAIAFNAQQNPINGTTSAQVRRLMPEEAEFLMGFPRGYTAITYRGKPAADGPRYRALGNSWAINCARWVGMRIAAVEGINAHE